MSVCFEAQESLIGDHSKKPGAANLPVLNGLLDAQ